MINKFFNLNKMNTCWSFIKYTFLYFTTLCRTYCCNCCKPLKKESHVKDVENVDIDITNLPIEDEIVFDGNINRLTLLEDDFHPVI